MIVNAQRRLICGKRVVGLKLINHPKDSVTTIELRPAWKDRGRILRILDKGKKTTRVKKTLQEKKFELCEEVQHIFQKYFLLINVDFHCKQLMSQSDCLPNKNNKRPSLKFFFLIKEKFICAIKYVHNDSSCLDLKIHMKKSIGQPVSSFFQKLSAVHILYRL